MKNQNYFNNKQIRKPLVRNRRDADKLIAATHQTTTLLALTVLHNKFGFGTKRLERFVDMYQDLLDSYNRGYVSVEDLNVDLEEETGIKVI